jgi:hypothetical protein
VNDADLFHRFALMSSAAAGGVTAGVGLLLFAPRTWVGRTAVAVVAVAVMSGLTALLAADSLGWVTGGGAALAAVAVLASTPTVRQFVGRCVRPLARPRVIGVAALLAAFGVWGYEAWRFDAANEANMDAAMAEVEVAPPTANTVAHAHTDRGTLIDLAAPADPVPVDELVAMSRRYSAVTLHAEQLISRGLPSDLSNCHGWVFTGGRYHVGGRHVDAILSDNGYAKVSEPAAGDVCVYRNADGEVAHTAVVRASLPDGTVLVESKWGRMGVYLHGAENSCYGTAFTYFRTARGTHLLNGLDEASTVEAASERP